MGRRRKKSPADADESSGTSAAIPAAVVEEAALLKEYRDLMQEFARELLKSRGKIRAERLNELSEAAVRTFVTYAAIYGASE